MFRHPKKLYSVLHNSIFVYNDTKLAAAFVQDMIFAEDTRKGKFLTFRLICEDYSIAIRLVTKIIGMQKITAVPDMEHFIKALLDAGQLVLV